MDKSIPSLFSRPGIITTGCFFIVFLLQSTSLSAAPPCGTRNGGSCPNEAPIAVISDVGAVTANTMITLDGSQSSDPEEFDLTYFWDQESGPSATILNSAEAITGVNIGDDGTYVFSLTVTETGNRTGTELLSGSTSKTITVGSVTPGPTTLVPKCGTSGSLDERVADCLFKMSLADKVGQMAMGDHLELKGDDHVISFKLGALLAGGGHAPESGNLPEDWRKMVDHYQQQALSTDMGIPLLFGIDAIHGHNNVFGATIFPHNIGLGATRDTDLACRIGHATAVEVAATGINWTFSPTLCVTRDERWGRSYECFSETPDIPSLMTSIIGGYQGTGPCTSGAGLAEPDSILATAKHWVGDGGTVGGVDQGDTPMAEIESLHVPPYYPAIYNEDVGSVMVSYNSVDGVKMHANPDRLISNRLKGAEGFEFNGIVLSDWTGIKQIDRNFTNGIQQAITGGIDQINGGVEAIHGGVDMAMEPYNYDSFVRELISLVESGSVSEGRINDAVTRILTAKIKLGLFDPPYGRQYADNDQTIAVNPIALDVVGAGNHRAIAREAVRKSLVLLKNDGALPVIVGDGAFKIVVAGKSADNIGNQSGGWTITWQGDSGDITLGDTIVDGVSNWINGTNDFTNENNVANPGNVTVELDVAPRSSVTGDFGIVVVGELPYAEGKGDDETLELSRKDLTAIDAVCNNMPCVVVLVSGRPLIITDLVTNPSVNAIVAAWLPGTEGGGVAEVLFGEYPFSGALPVSWPRAMSQVPINVGDDGYTTTNTPLYPME